MHVSRNCLVSSHYQSHIRNFKCSIVHQHSLEQILAAVPVVAEWRNYTCKKWTEDMVDYYDCLEPSRDLDELQRLQPSDPKFWQLDDVDRHGLPQESHSGRRCQNCKQRDHLSKNCPKPKKICCHICGDGGHTHLKCPKAMCLRVNINFNIFCSSFFLCLYLYAVRQAKSGVHRVLSRVPPGADGRVHEVHEAWPHDARLSGSVAMLPSDDDRERRADQERGRTETS